MLWNGATQKYGALSLSFKSFNKVSFAEVSLESTYDKYFQIRKENYKKDYLDFQFKNDVYYDVPISISELKILCLDSIKRKSFIRPNDIHPSMLINLSGKKIRNHQISFIISGYMMHFQEIRHRNLEQKTE